MATGNFEACLALTLRFEGGYSDHPLDPGGATNFGITRATLAAVRGRPVAKAEVMALSRDEASGIYRRLYWNAVAGDLLPPGVDLAIFDMAVNSAPARAMAALRAELGLPAGGGLDAAALAAAGGADATALTRAICRRRLAFLHRLTRFATFGPGWSRRIAAVEAAALALVAGAYPRKPASGMDQDRPTSGSQQRGLLMTMTLPSETNESKPFWASQTVWSSVAVIGSSLAGSVLAWKSGDMAAFGTALTAVLGGINAIVGRFRAVSALH